MSGGCTCTVDRSFGPDARDDAEQDPFCPNHHFPLEELRAIAERNYERLRQWETVARRLAEILSVCTPAGPRPDIGHLIDEQTAALAAFVALADGAP